MPSPSFQGCSQHTALRESSHRSGSSQLSELPALISVIDSWGLQERSHCAHLPRPTQSAHGLPRTPRAQSFPTSRNNLPVEDSTLSSSDLVAVLCRIERLPTALEMATEALIKENAQSQIQMQEMLERFQRDQALLLNKHAQSLERHSLSLESMEAAIETFQQKWSAVHEQARALDVQLSQLVSQPTMIETPRKIEEVPIYGHDEWLADEPIEVYQGNLSHETPQSTEVTNTEQHHAHRKNRVRELQVTLGWKEKGRLAAEHGSWKSTSTSGTDVVHDCFIDIGNHFAFRGLVTFMIIANIVVIAVGSDLAIQTALKSRSTPEDWTEYMDYFVFTPFFSLELFVRVMAERKYFFIGRNVFWNLFDGFLLVSVFCEVSLSTQKITFFRALRIFRILRFMRVLRVIKVFSQLRHMISAILSSLLTLSWAFVLLVVIQSAFAIFFLHSAANYLVEEDNFASVQYAYVAAGIEEHFPNFDKGVYTLMAVISGGMEWTLIANLFKEISVVYQYLVVMYIMFVVFGVLNVLTGVFVTSSQEIFKVDRELVIQSQMDRAESFMNQLSKLFHDFDDDQSGTITLDEFETHLSNPQVKAYFSELQIDIHEAEGLFSLLDVQGDGEVPIEEFLVGCMRLKGEARSIDVAHLMYEHKKQAQMQLAEFDCIRLQLKKIYSKINGQRITQASPR